ncbi:MAG: hypothetical protein JXR22_13815, partial [Prolixibacteraceae bacterium]|nr:hypothetical protein [Prolixibacteraceae bacterium]
MRKIIKYLILTINILLAFSLGISYLSMLVDPGKLWWPSLFGLAYVYLLVLNIGFVVFWLFFHRLFALLSLLVLLLGWNVHMQNFQLSGSSAEQKGIKV